MSFSERVDLDNLIQDLRRTLGAPAISPGDPQQLLLQVADALESLNRRVKRLEDESEAGHRATIGLR